MSYQILYRNVFLNLVVFFLLSTTYAQGQSNDGPNAFLETAMVYVKDWDASLDFYTRYLGYEITGQGEIADEKSKDSLGMDHSTTGRFAYLAPKPSFLKKENIVNGSTIGIIEVRNDRLAEYERMMNSIKAIKGEVVMVYEVDDLKKIRDMMMADNIQVVSDFSISGSGRSHAFAVLDPNGIRVEMFEYLPEFKAKTEVN